MIKANELRIGNLVEYTLLGIRQIETGADIDNIFEDAGMPIPLTEEWVQRLGFYGSTSLERYIGPHGRKLGWEPRGVYILEDDNSNGPFLSHIRYVHQLQNLYFALTGEELQIQDHA